MKRFLLALASSFVIVTQASAIVGGPFDNNSFFGTDSTGTYQGVVTGSGISGIMVFGTSGISSVDVNTRSMMGTYGNAGRALFFVRGTLVSADVASVADMADRHLTLALTGSVSYGTTDVERIGDPGFGVSYTLEGVSQLSGYLEARFTQTFPQLRFSGSGTIDMVTTTDLTPVYDDNNNVVSYEIHPEYNEFNVNYYGVRTSYQTPAIVGTLPWYYPEVTVVPDSSGN